MAGAIRATLGGRVYVIYPVDDDGDNLAYVADPISIDDGRVVKILRITDDLSLEFSFTAVVPEMASDEIEEWLATAHIALLIAEQNESIGGGLYESGQAD